MNKSLVKDTWGRFNAGIWGRYKKQGFVINNYAWIMDMKKRKISNAKNILSQILTNWCFHIVGSD